MIMNPVLSGGGAGKMEHKITDKTGYVMPSGAKTTAAPGEFVEITDGLWEYPVSICDAQGREIPFSRGLEPPCFIMPQSDVTIIDFP